MFELKIQVFHSTSVIISIESIILRLMDISIQENKMNLSI